MASGTDRGVSSVVGVVLLLGITIIGTGAVVGIGSQAFADAERTATTSQAGHALTQFDSKAAIVALGESSSQRVDLGPSGDGEFVAENDSAWLRVVHHNATGAGSEEEIYNASLGSVSYRNGDTEIAYQGGGVWERRGNGSVMRSPPEFNYRRATLTLPAIRVTSEGKASGRTTAVVTQGEESRRVYPNSSASYDDGSAYDNPITAGNVTVTVQSRFYEGWADFFRTRTSGNVSVDHDNRRATVELVTPDKIGKFDMLEVLGEDGVTARGKASGHTLSSFNVTLETEGKGNSFNNQEVDFTVESDSGTLTYTVATSKGCKQGGGPLSVDVTYENSSVTHEWENTSVTGSSGPIRLDCDGDDGTLVLDFTSDQRLTYQGSENVTFGHDDAPDEPRTFESGDSTDIEQLSNHYVALLGDEFTLNADLKSSGSQLDKTASTGVFDYETDGRKYIAYLHVTENEIEVELE